MRIAIHAFPPIWSTKHFSLHYHFSTNVFSVILRSTLFYIYAMLYINFSFADTFLLSDGDKLLWLQRYLNQ